MPLKRSHARQMRVLLLHALSKTECLQWRIPPPTPSGPLHRTIVLRREPQLNFQKRRLPAQWGPPDKSRLR
ncbi:unnamed protein product, partial [Iphiclides podalirius]